MSNLRQKGFTLIELLIVVAIIGFLASIAYPSYQESVAKARRGDAQASLVSLAQEVERQYTENSTYAGAVLPYTEAPKDGNTKFYDLSFAASTATTYTLQAAPKNGMNGDRCGTMTLNHAGNRTAAETDCWR